MTAVACLPEFTAWAEDSKPMVMQAQGPTRRSDVGLVLLVLLVLLGHLLVLLAVGQVRTAQPIVQPPVLQGALVQTAAAIQPEPVAEQVPLPEPKPTEPAPKPDHVPEPLPVKDGRLASAPKPLPEYTEPEPVVKELVEQPPEPVAQPQEPAPPTSAPVTAPRADASHLNNPAPAYPMVSRRLREQGTVLLELLIEADGQISELAVLQSSGFPRLDQAALEAVKQWRFEPARQGGSAIAYRYQQPITFQLH
ncbi:energy transducer TonB [Alkalimonas sp. MEB108]|uniref:Protein TonB n=1 Tax=Alkalimonas cellulosilytica TaxID=3058395 RepID=A0ABU7J2T6_9GAMM|nr:energy transducer TonB [Alkalimonas sp. MEB108]MEE2000818.1 energy transducer TonB [Alkalimonas sp. MEB108]